jgi:uncharacterized membrane protein
MQLNPLLNFGPFGQSAVGSQGLIGASVSAMSLVSAAAEIANGQHQIQTALAVNLPGVASATLQLTIGEPPVGTSWVTVGGLGASVHTAQTRLLLTVQLLGNGSTGAVTVPIYIEIASGQATLNSIQCPTSTQGGSVTLGVTPGIATAWIGQVSSSLMSNFSTTPVVGPATLVNLSGLATVTGSAEASISNLQPTAVTFSSTDIANDVMHTVSTTDFISSLVSSLIGDLTLHVNVMGLGIGLPSGLTHSVASVISAAARPIDQILAEVLSTLGVSLGNADTWVEGVKCSTAVLVQ